jgi:hypothetical protein
MRRDLALSLTGSLDCGLFIIGEKTILKQCVTESMLYAYKYGISPSTSRANARRVIHALDLEAGDTKPKTVSEPGYCSVTSV